MYALVEIAGEQFRVEEGQKIKTQKQEGDIGTKLEFDKVLLVGGSDNVAVGQPTLEGSVIQGTIVEQYREPKVVVFKKKRRKGYRVTRGHRQPKTTVRIDSIKA